MRFDTIKSYNAFEPIDFGEFEAIGWFHYEVATLDPKHCVPVPRALFNHVETVLQRKGVMDNKVVVIFRDKMNFGTDDFAIQFKDCYCKMGRWSDVIGYGGNDLK